MVPEESIGNTRLNVLVLVPSRGGSKGIPGKNLREVGGVSLVGRSVLMGRRFAALNPAMEIRVVVDSDDPTILREGRRWGGMTPYLRPASLAQDNTSTYESTFHLLQRLDEDGFKADALLLLQPTSPLRSLADVCNCWEYRQISNAASVVSISEATKSPRFAMRLDDAGVLFWDGPPPPVNARRQDLPAAYFPNGSVYIEDVPFLHENQTFVAEGLTHGVVTSHQTSIDVDEELDLLVANAISNWRPHNVPEVTVLRPDSTQHLADVSVGVAWAGPDDELVRWVSGEWPRATDVLIHGSLGEEAEGRSHPPALGMWRSLGVNHLTLVIPDACVLERYRSQLGLADRVIAPSELVDQIRALLSESRTSHNSK